MTNKFSKNNKTKNIISTLAVLALAVFGLAFSAGSASAATVSSAFTSKAIDTGQNNYSWGNITWNTTHPSAATKIELRAKSGSTTSITGIGSCPIIATITSVNAIDATGVSLTANSNTCVVAGDRYLKYEATLTTTDQAVTPSLNSANISYNHYPSQTLISSAFNSSDGGNVLAQISWEQDATLPAGSLVKFQARSAPNNDNGTPGNSGDDFPGSWSSFVGPESGSSCDTNYFTYTPGGASADNGCGCADDGIQLDGNRKITCSLASGHSLKTASPADQWLQYKVFLNSGGANTPALYDATMVYVINAPPVVSNVTAVQNSNGTISIGYDLADLDFSADPGFTASALVDIGITLNEALTSSDATAITLSSTSLLPASGTVQIGSEQISYTAKHANGTDLVGTIVRGANNTLAAEYSSGAAVWIKGTTVSGNVGTLTSITSTPAAKTASWTIKTDLPGVSVGAVPGAKIRVSVNDGNAANHVGNGDSTAFVLDTKNPVGSLTGGIPVKLDMTNSQLAIGVSGTAGETASKMRFSNADLSGTACASGAWTEDYAASRSISDLNLSPASGVYTVYWQFRDDYCNMISGSASTPPAPTSVNAGDVSYGGLYKYRNLVWWTAQNTAGVTYKVYRKPNLSGADSYELLGTVTDPSNYCFDKSQTSAATCDDSSFTGTGTAQSPLGLASATRYYYKITAEKSDGVSPYSSEVNSMPTGTLTGKTDTTAPSIAFEPTNDLATIPEPATGIGKTASTARFKWTTTSTDSDDNAYSLVKYRKSGAGSWSIAGDAQTFGAAHDVTLSNLEAGATYDYQLLSADQKGNSVVYPASGNVTVVTSAPSVVEANPSYVAGTSKVSIYWTTSGKAGSQIRSIASPGDPSSETPTTLHSEKATTHYAAIASGLIPATTYNYQIILQDGDNNSVVYQTTPGQYYTFATLANTSDTELPSISGISSGTPLADSATISFTITDNSGNAWALVEYGTNPTLASGTIFAGSVSNTPAAPPASLALGNLRADTRYYYRIYAGDDQGNVQISSPIRNFDTAALSISESNFVNSSPPYVASRDSATIYWTTIGASRSRVVSTTTAFASTSYISATADHYAVISGLSAGTSYNYQIILEDGNGNTTTFPASNSYQFTTLSDTAADSSAPSITPAKLSAAIADPASTSAITLTSTANLPASGTIQIDDEKISYTGISGATLTGISRGAYNTTAATHSANTLFAAITDNTAYITFSASDASGPSLISAEYEPSLSKPSSSSYSKEAATPTAINSGAYGLVLLEGLSSNTKHYYKLKARDAFGNTRSDTGGANGYYFTTNTDVVAPAISTAPSAAVAPASASITWTTSEQVKSKVEYSSTINPDCTGALYTSATTLTANLNKDQTASLTALAPATKYCYRLYMIDTAGNPGTDDASGAGYTFTTLPLIPIIDSGSVVLAGKTATTANITWTTTNVKSSSLIDFGATLAYGFTQGNSSYLVTAHDITLVGLAPGASYKYRVKSIDALGNTVTDDNSGQGYAFTTDSLASSGALPAISSVYAGSIASTSAVVYWSTAESSDSVVSYGLAAGAYKSETGSSGLTTTHAVALAGLSPSTTYYYKVKSRTAANQAETNDNSSSGYTFATAAGTEKIPPSISAIQVSSATANKAAISWTTDENSSSLVDFGVISGVYTSTQGNPADSVSAHSVELKSLTPATPYFFRVRSIDASGNSAAAVGAGFSTTAGAAVDCPATGSSRSSWQEAESCPVIDTSSPIITNIKVSNITFNSATITWTTDEASNSMVNYDTYSYDIKGKYAYSSGNSDELVKSHSVILNNLDSATTYYFRVLSTDNRGNTAKSPDQSFKTPAISESRDKGAATAESLKKQFEDIAKTLVKDNLATEENVKELLSRIANPPVIGSEGPIVKDIKSYGATIVWQTDRKANSIVKFTAEEKTNSLGKLISWEERGKLNEFDTNHEVSLLGLAPSTTYSFQAQSQDILGNTSSSDTKTFTTASASSIFNVAVTDLNLTSAKITWETANISTSSLEYGPSANYGNYQENRDEKVRKHSILLANLAPSSVFHFRVRSTEELGTILVSDDYSFATPSLPEITKYLLGEVKDNSIALTWTSNIPINTNVRYTDTQTNETKNLGKEEKTTDHALALLDLEAGQTYRIEIQGRDEAGNLASVPAFDVQTGMDTISPEISQVRSQSAVLSTAEDRVQSIISWRTNELSSTQVLWDLGGTRGDTLANESVLDANLTTNHIIVLTQFKPGTVYRFRVASTDKFGNAAVSADYTVMAPVKRQSIIQMIINQFENIFGWTKGLGI